MAGNYIVKQGEHVAGIAAASGFSNFHTIWDDPNNADLKQERQNPDVLFPGDVVFIPDRQFRTESRSTDKRHPFQTRVPVLKLRLTLEDIYEKPIAGAKCDLLIGSEFRHVTTDGQGRIEETIPPNAHDAILLIRDLQTPANDVQIPIKIGDLNPVEKLSGQQSRLNNLGYFPGDAKTADDPQFRSAVEEFQCDHPPLTIDGDCGSKTQTKLKQVHGC